MNKNKNVDYLDVPNNPFGVEKLKFITDIEIVSEWKELKWKIKIVTEC